MNYKLKNPYFVLPLLLFGIFISNLNAWSDNLIDGLAADGFKSEKPATVWTLKNTGVDSLGKGFEHLVSFSGQTKPANLKFLSVAFWQEINLYELTILPGTFEEKVYLEILRIQKLSNPTINDLKKLYRLFYDIPTSSLSGDQIEKVAKLTNYVYDDTVKATNGNVNKILNTVIEGLWDKPSVRAVKEAGRFKWYKLITGNYSSILYEDVSKSLQATVDEKSVGNIVFITAKKAFSKFGKAVMLNKKTAIGSAIFTVVAGGVLYIVMRDDDGDSNETAAQIDSDSDITPEQESGVTMKQRFDVHQMEETVH